MNPLAKTDIVVLAGGLGTRLSSVLPNAPKILAPIGGDRTYLDFFLGWLAGQGATRVVLALGHRAEMVQEYLTRHKPPLEVAYSIEDKPLGTAGALKLALPQVKTDPVLVLNGDSWTDVDLNAFITQHAQAALSLLCVRVEDAARYGTLTLHATTVTGFREKDATMGAGVISAGAYLFSRTACDELMCTPGASLEQDFFEKRLDLKPQAFISPGPFIDIGTPESLQQAPFVLPT